MSTLNQKPLSELAVGQKAKVLKVRGKGTVFQRLLDMGIVKGALLEVERVAPLGDPIEIKIKGYHLSLRRSEAAHISVEPSEKMPEKESHERNNKRKI